MNAKQEYSHDRIRNEQRRFTRVELALPVEVHQGGSVWHQRLIDISLTGVATDQPDVWDAQYNEPFTLIITLDDDSTLELHAYLQHVEAGGWAFPCSTWTGKTSNPCAQCWKPIWISPRWKRNSASWARRQSSASSASASFDTAVTCIPLISPLGALPWARWRA